MQTLKKTLFATALLTAFAGAAAPALANDQLALSLGVEPGRYTTAQLVILKGAMNADTSGESSIFMENTRFSADKSIHNPTALAHFERSDASDDHND